MLLLQKQHLIPALCPASGEAGQLGRGNISDWKIQYEVENLKLKPSVAEP